ncbi:hypothetical protein [Micromonospora sp. LOL_023]|uniref:WD40 repeat domain-containing protein n=1 Tax=Micromonospora sp. LOL_023 TaxID=3345418 RepID=UPI003A84E841
MEDFRLRLVPGSVIVFEGLDRAGKSTQLAMLTQVVEPSSAELVHMPSGKTPFTQGVYSLLEQDGPRSGFARQLAHTGRVNAVAVLPRPDGRHHIVTGSGGGVGDGSVRVWDPDTGEQLAEITGHTGGVTAVTVLPGPDGRHHIVTGGRDRAVMVFVSRTEKPTT